MNETRGVRYQPSKSRPYPKDVVTIVPVIKTETKMGTTYAKIKDACGKNVLSVLPEKAVGQCIETQVAGVIAEVVMLHPDETPIQIRNRMHGNQAEHEEEIDQKWILEFPMSRETFHQISRSKNEMDAAKGLMAFQPTSHLDMATEMKLPVPSHPWTIPRGSSQSSPGESSGRQRR
ncbi:hypothetical protein H0H93_006626 [Arthromyces matolae]|nr:hypothetical protein H0H93_006626 [Arthromyces matolae]